MNIVVVCQARLSSTRLPRKVLLPLAGEPLIQRFMERVSRAKLASGCVVATTTDATDDTLADLCIQKGFEVYRGHPTDLLDRHYKTGLEYNADVVVKIPSDCPLIDPMVIDRVLAEFLAHEDKADFVSNLHPATYPDGNDVEVMTMDALTMAWKNARRPYEREHTTPWLWDANDSVRCLNVVLEGGRDYSMSHRWTIDYAEDYTFLRAVYQELYPANKHFTVEDVLALVRAHPEIEAINAHLAGVNWYGRHLDELRTITQAATRPFPAP